VPELLGFTGIALVALLTLFMALRWPMVGKILIIALVVRVAAILFGYFVAPLPDSHSDAVSFERRAWLWAEGGFLAALGHFTGPHSYFISWIIAVFYALTDRSLLMAQSISLFFGMGTVWMGWLLARRLWGQHVANTVGWVLALFPTLVLYSALTMREAYIWFFVLVALYGVVSWVQTRRATSLAIALLGFIGATMFHGAMVIGAVVFLGIVSVYAIQRSFMALRRHNVHLQSCAMLGFATVAFVLFVSGAITVPKLGSFENAANWDTVVSVIESRTIGSGGQLGAAYPDWLIPNSPIELTYIAPARVAYFVFSPFPWDVRSAQHLVGLFDALLYIALFGLIFTARKQIMRDPAARALAIIMAAYLLVFSFGVGNFGASIRHRAKFFAALTVLAAPALVHLMERIKRQPTP